MQLGLHSDKRNGEARYPELVTSCPSLRDRFMKDKSGQFFTSFFNSSSRERKESSLDELSEEERQRVEDLLNSRFQKIPGAVESWDNFLFVNFDSLPDFTISSGLESWSPQA